MFEIRELMKEQLKGIQNCNETKHLPHWYTSNYSKGATTNIG